MPSARSLTEAERRMVATWAADCAERVLHLFEAEALNVGVPREAIARVRAYALGELDAADEIAWQLAHKTPPVRKALQQLPPLCVDSADPLGTGLLTSGILGTSIRAIQSAIGVTAEVDD